MTSYIRIKGRVYRVEENPTIQPDDNFVINFESAMRRGANQVWVRLVGGGLIMANGAKWFVPKVEGHENDRNTIQFLWNGAPVADIPLKNIKDAAGARHA